MKKLLALTTAFFLLTSCGHKNKENTQKENLKKPTVTSRQVCSQDTPLAKVGDKTITLSYYKEIENTIPKWALDKFYGGPEGRKRLLEKIVDRQLILRYEKDKGYFDRPDVKKRFESFVIRQLGGRYLNSQVKDFKVSEKEVEEFIKKHYKNKKISPMEKSFIKMNLEAQKFEKQRQEALAKVQSKISFEKVDLKHLKDNTLLATYEGKKIYFKDVKPLLGKKVTKDSLKDAVTDYVLYLLALQAGIDKSSSYQALINRMMEDAAVSAFEKEVLSKIKISDSEIKKYYEEHKKEMKMPASAQVVIYQFKNKEEAKKALALIEKGEPVKNAVPPTVLATAKRWTVLSTDVGRNPVATLVFENKKDRSIVEMPNGTVILVIVEKRTPEKPMLYGDAYEPIKRKLMQQKFEKVADEILGNLKKKYGVQIFDKNLNCLTM